MICLIIALWTAWLNSNHTPNSPLLSRVSLLKHYPRRKSNIKSTLPRKICLLAKVKRSIEINISIHTFVITSTICYRPSCQIHSKYKDTFMALNLWFRCLKYSKWSVKKPFKKSIIRLHRVLSGATTFLHQ